MRETVEKLWNEYFLEECARIESAEERALEKRAALLHERANELLTVDAIEKYAEALYAVQRRLVKKAFFKGCKCAAALFSGAELTDITKTTETQA